MIIAAEMQDAMDQQRHELFFQGASSRLGLSPSRWHRDHDVPQVDGCLTEAMRRSRLPERKGENVRTAILVPVPAIELPHSPITDEREIHVCRRFSGEAKDGLRQSQDSPATDSYRPNMDLEGNGH